MREINKLELDSIVEITAIGAGHASKALSQMTGKKITVKFPEVQMRNLEDIPKQLGSPGDIVATVYVGLKSKGIDGNNPVGSMVFVYPMDSAVELSALLLEKEDYELIFSLM